MPERSLPTCPGCFGPHWFSECPSREATHPNLRRLIDLAVAAEGWQSANVGIDLTHPAALTLWDATTAWTKGNQHG
jgi:hypothetical protein